MTLRVEEEGKQQANPERFCSDLIKKKKLEGERSATSTSSPQRVAPPQIAVFLVPATGPGGFGVEESHRDVPTFPSRATCLMEPF